jgi:hypothetical protein
MTIDDPGAELRAFGQAGRQVLNVIRQAAADRDGGALSAIEAVFLLDDAMQELREFQTTVPALLDAAESGEFEAGMRARADELAALAERVAGTRRELELVKAKEQETTIGLTELSALRQQVDELRRRERLATALRELNEQRQVIEQRLTLLRQLTEDQEDALGASAGQVITLAEERRVLLAAQVRGTLAKAAQVLASLGEEEERVRAEQERLDDAERRLAEARQRHADLAAERDGRIAQLAAHAVADNALAAALGTGAGQSDPVARLRTVLDAVVTQLTEVDVALKNTLISGQGDYDRQHAVVSWAAP